jgi:2-dehydro-3-deoxyphosphogluconate aldolase / (4S)-4-hydroxy-2-oxoglutarate aldolase
VSDAGALGAEVLARLERQRVVPVLRSGDVEDAIATARACAGAGMTVIELTHSTPGVEWAVSALRDEGLLVGVGTITNADQVRHAVEAGAEFVVSFALVPEMVQVATALRIPAIPGAYTPSEVAACLRAGAPAVKIFPAREHSPAYLRDLRAVMPELRAIVTGGLSASAAEIRPWLEAGALAVGLGSDLGSVANDGAEQVERRARRALETAADV